MFLVGMDIRKPRYKIDSTMVKGHSLWQSIGPRDASTFKIISANKHQRTYHKMPTDECSGQLGQGMIFDRP